MAGNSCEISRITESVSNASDNHAADPFFVTARSGKTYFGPINFPSDFFGAANYHFRSDRGLRGRYLGRTGGPGQRPLRVECCARDSILGSPVTHMS